MSTTIEERIVSMKFQGEQFLAGVDKSLTKLEQFNAKMKAMGDGGSLDKVGAAAERLGNGGMNALAGSVDKIAGRFKAMGVVAITALSTITNQALTAGQNLAKSLTIAPILDGFHEYETNMNSIQTILSNTQAAGTKLNDVTAVLDDLNHYSDQTIYNFAEMAKNIGTFTAAGVGLKPAAQAIKGIANLAALSGSNSEQASGAMYQLSQAISAGRVSLEDWNSVVNAGMGGTVFQRALAQNAEKLGTLSKGAVQLKGDMKNVTIQGKSFRESITAKPGEQSWLTSKVLTQTLSQFTGDLTRAQLAAMGFRGEAADAILKQAEMAKQAATQVKTLTQLMGTIKESVGSGWASTWKIIFGDFEEAKGLFTGVSNSLGKIVQDSANARNKMLTDWDTAGGRTALIDALGNSFNALLGVLKPIKQAWAQAFPAKSGSQLAEITKNVANFTKNLIPGTKTMENLRRTFAGVFAVLGIGWDVLKQVIGLFARLFGAATEGKGGFLEFTGSVGDFLVNLRQAIKDGKGLETFFKKLGDILEVPIKGLKALGTALKNAFEKFDSSGIVSAVDKISDKLNPMANQADKVATAWDKVTAALGRVWGVLKAIGKWVASKFSGVAEDFAKGFEGLNFEDITRGINTGLFAGLLLMVKNFFGGGSGGFLEKISEAIEGFTGVLQGMQNALNAGALVGLALAIGLLALSLNVMAKIDAGGLTRGTAAMAGLFAQLSGTVLLLQNFATFKGAATLPAVALSMILLAGAVAILAFAMEKLSALSWEEIAKGLTAVTALMVVMVAMAQRMPKGKSFILAAASLVIMAFGIKVLAGAVQTLGDMSWEDMARGLVGVGVLLAALSIFANKTSISTKGLISGVVIYLMAKAISALADAVKDIATLSWSEMAKGMTAMAGGLGLIAGALKVLPPSSLLSAVAIMITAQSLSLINDALAQGAGMSWADIGKGLTVMSVSLYILAGALKAMQNSVPGAGALIIAAVALGIITGVLKLMAGLSWEDIAKGLTAIGGALLILSLAMESMENSLKGAQALIIAAAALAIIAPVLVTLGNMSWQEVVTGLIALAGVFAVLGVAALVLEPVIPAMIGLGIAVAAIGVAMLAAGAGVALFGLGITLVAAGLAALAVSGVAGTTAIIAMIAVLIGGLPTIVKLIGALLVAILDLVIQTAPKLGQAAYVLISVLIQVIGNLTPKIVDMILKLLTMLLNKLADYVPKMVDAAGRLITGLLNGLAKNVGKMATAATNLITRFLDAIGTNAPKVADAGAKMVIKLVNGIADAIRNNSEAMGKAGANLGVAIIQGMANGIKGGIGVIGDAARSAAHAALDAAKSVLGIHSPSKEFEKIGKYVNVGFRKGLDGSKTLIDTAFKDLKTKISDLYKSAGEDIKTLTNKLDKLQHARKKDKKAIRETAAALKQAKKEQAEALAVQKYMKTLTDEQSALGKLANQYDVLSEKIKAAQDVYDNAVKTRDDYNKSISDQFGNALDPTGEMTTAGYLTDLKKQLEDTKTFANEIQQLRALGLNDETYKDLLSQGTSAIPFVEELLKGGKEQIDQVNDLNKQLDSVSASMGETASTALYQAAVDSAAGIVKGLQNQQAAIEAQMDKIADAMVKAIKKKLGIKSPSRVFAEVGKFSAEGLTAGLEKNAGTVAMAAASMGDNAVDAIRVSLSNIDKAVAANIDVQPTIRPVLDLTDIQKGASKIGSLLPADAKMSLNGAYSTASGVATAVNERFSGGNPDGTSGASGAMLNYTQNIYSPKAVSAVDAYRGTKNQLSTVKGALS